MHRLLMPKEFIVPGVGSFSHHWRQWQKSVLEYSADGKYASGVIIIKEEKSHVEAGRRRSAQGRLPGNG